MFQMCCEGFNVVPLIHLNYHIYTVVVVDEVVVEVVLVVEVVEVVLYFILLTQCNERIS